MIFNGCAAPPHPLALLVEMAYSKTKAFVPEFEITTELKSPVPLTAALPTYPDIKSGTKVLLVNFQLKMVPITSEVKREALVAVPPQIT